MESNFAGAPPAEAEEQAVQQTEPTPQTEPAAPAPAEQQNQGEENPILAKLAQMEQRIDERLPAQQQESSPAPDLLDALLGEEDPAGGQDVQAQPGAEQPQGEGPVGPEAQAELDMLRQFVREEAQQMVSPYIQQQNAKEIRALQQEFPDITKPEILEPLERTVGDFIAQTGNESLAENADFVRRAYKLVKAEMADASAVPAESAATNGASLETNGGASQLGSAEQSVEEFYKQSVFQTGAKDPILG